MAYPKRYWVKLKVPKLVLSTLPDFPTPISKTRLKKISAEERRNALAAAAAASLTPGTANTGLLAATTGVNSTSPSKLSSPVPSDSVSVSVPVSGVASVTHKPTGQTSTAGLTMNAVTNTSALLDRTGRRVRPWTRKKHTFKTFTGFTVERVTWRTEVGADDKREPIIPRLVASMTITASPTPDIKTEA